MAEFGERRFDVGSVISRTFETIGSNAPLFIGLALLLTGLPALAVNWWRATGVATIGLTGPGALFTGTYLMPIFGGWLVTMITGAVLQAALTRATVTHLSGERPDFTQCLTVGLTLILPMIGLSVLMTLGVFLAVLFLIVPGIILWLCWSVVVPVYVQEKVGMFEAFGRSIELTRGARWRIFLTMLVFVIMVWLLFIPVSMVTNLTSADTGSLLVVALLRAVMSALIGLVMVTVQASIYVELRDVKDGVAPADLEAIFT